MNILPPVRNLFPVEIITVSSSAQFNTGTGAGLIPFIGPVTAANFSSYPLGLPLGVLTALYYANAVSLQGSLDDTFVPVYSHVFPEGNYGTVLDRTVRFVGGSGAGLFASKSTLPRVAAFPTFLGAVNCLPPAIGPAARAFIFGGNPSVSFPAGPIYLYNGLYYPYFVVDCLGLSGVAATTQGETSAPYNSFVSGYVTLKMGTWSTQIPLYGAKAAPEQVTCNLVATVYPYTA